MIESGNVLLDSHMFLWYSKCLFYLITTTKNVLKNIIFSKIYIQNIRERESTIH